MITTNDPKAPGGVGFFGGTASSGYMDATIVLAMWLTSVQEELKAILVAAGMAPDETGADLAQVLAALDVLFVAPPALAAEVAARIAADTAEATARAAEDTTLQTNITAETTARTAAITAEATARAAEDTTLQANITAEGTARAAEDTTLQTNITAEGTARAAADTAILAQFTNGGAAANATAAFANGYIRKRGTVNTSTGNGDLVYFDTPFPNACVNIVVSEGEAAGWDVGGTVAAVVYGVQLVDKTQFKLYAVKGGAFVGGATAMWQAEGI